MAPFANKTIPIRQKVSDKVIVKFDAANRVYYMAAPFWNTDTLTTNILTVKFNIVYNQTEWVKYTNETVNLTLREVVHCSDDGMVVTIGEIPLNNFQDAAAGETSSNDPQNHNTNIFLVAYQASFGVTAWNQMCGDTFGNDSFAGAKYYNGI